MRCINIDICETIRRKFSSKVAPFNVAHEGENYDGNTAREIEEKKVDLTFSLRILIYGNMTADEKPKKGAGRGEKLQKSLIFKQFPDTNCLTKQRTTDCNNTFHWTDPHKPGKRTFKVQ
jgi:hypothetical protein